jgi:hypothetical protein
MSQFKREQWQDPGYRALMIPVLASNRTPETEIKRLNNLKARFQDPEFVNKITKNISPGWNKGMQFPQESKRMMGNKCSEGLVWVKKGDEELRIHQGELDTYLLQGWQPGRIPLMWVHRDGMNSRVKTFDLEAKLRDGWMLGQLPKKPESVV